MAEEWSIKFLSFFLAAKWKQHLDTSPATKSLSVLLLLWQPERGRRQPRSESVSVRAAVSCSQLDRLPRCLALLLLALPQLQWVSSLFNALFISSFAVRSQNNWSIYGFEDNAHWQHTTTHCTIFQVPRTCPRPQAASPSPGHTASSASSPARPGSCPPPWGPPARGSSTSPSMPRPPSGAGRGQRASGTSRTSRTEAVQVQVRDSDKIYGDFLIKVFTGLNPMNGHNEKYSTHVIKQVFLKRLTCFFYFQFLCYLDLNESAMLLRLFW